MRPVGEGAHASDRPDPLVDAALVIGGASFDVVGAVDTEGRAATYRVRTPDGEGFLKLARDIPPQSALVAGLRNEAEVLARVTGSDLPTLLAAGAVAGGGFGVVTRWVAGRPLGPASGTPDVRRRLLVGLARALERVHASGFVHGDVRPGNVLVRDDGAGIVLVDFDAATRIGTAQPAFVGAPSFASPEQRAGACLGVASDAHALAATVRRLLPDEAVTPTLAAQLAAALDPDPGRRPSIGDLASALA